MLPRIQRLPHICRHLKRTYTTSTELSTDTSPSRLHTQIFSKVRAFHFRLNPWDAQGLMDAADIAIRGRFREQLYRHWSTSGAGLPVLLFAQFRKLRTPLRVKALYFPVWNLSFSTTFLSLTKKAGITENNVMQKNRYIPGSTTPYYLAGSDIGHTFQDLLPAGCDFPSPLAECLNPHGLEAQCLPFTISPFALIDACMAYPNAKSKVMSGGEVILPSTLKFNLFAAFPVMIPVYAAEYAVPATDGNPGFTYTLYVHGSRYKARLSGILPYPHGNKLPPYENPENPGYIEVHEYPMHEFIEAISSFPALRTDDDVCIRPLTEEEYDPVDRYITVSKAHNEMFNVDIKSWPRAAINDFEAKRREDQKRANEYLPSWWSESKYSRSITQKKREPVKKERPLKSRSSPI